MSDPPGRDTRTARSDRRRSWYGTGKLITVEKNGFGRWLDDVAYAFADISIAGLPILWYVLLSEDLGYFGLKSAALVAWLTMVLGAATIRGGWITPLGTDVPGWVTPSLSLAVLRLGFYNAALGVAAYGGVWVAGAVGVDYASVVVSFLTGAVAVGAFPRFADVYYRRVLDWRASRRQ